MDQDTMVSVVMLSLYALGNVVALTLFGAIVIDAKPTARRRRVRMSRG